MCVVRVFWSSPPTPSAGRPFPWTAQNFALFFLSRRKFLPFFSLWGSSRGILVVFEAPCPQNVHVCSGCRAKPRWPQSPQEREERKKIVAGEGKKTKFWAAQRRGSGGGGGPGEEGGRPGGGGGGSGRAPKSWTNTHTHTHTHSRNTHTDRHTKSTIWANWSDSNWPKSTIGLCRKSPDWPESNWPKSSILKIAESTETPQLRTWFKDEVMRKRAWHLQRALDSVPRSVSLAKLGNLKFSLLGKDHVFLSRVFQHSGGVVVVVACVAPLTTRHRTPLRRSWPTLAKRLWPNRLWPILVFWPNFQPKKPKPQTQRLHTQTLNPERGGQTLPDPTLRAPFGPPPLRGPHLFWVCCCGWCWFGSLRWTPPPSVGPTSPGPPPLPRTVKADFGQSIFGHRVWPANFGQSIFGQSILGQSIFFVVVVGFGVS